MRPGTRKWIFAIFAVGLAATAGSRLGPINQQRAAHGLINPPLPRNMAPSMLLSPLLALGRAPLVDYLWLRATDLKEQGRFFDAYQLANMICELQPKFAAVWAFQGWNMAYNISVTFKTPEERWRWVKNGYELIRDKGIPLNPQNTQLYRELAWILFHKVGDFMDEWHFYYKLQFALQMQDVLGPPPENFVEPGRVPDDYYRDYNFAALAAAPQKWDVLVADPFVTEFASQLKKMGFDAELPGIYLGLLDALRDNTVQIPDVPPGEVEGRMHALRTLMTDPKNADVRGKIERYWRALRLRNELKLDPQRIVDLQKGIGVTLDFRLPESHALYWANLGIEKGLTVRSYVDVHRLNTTRIEFFCLQKMFHRGRMAMSSQAKLGEPPLLAPDIRVVPALKEAYVRDSAEYLKKENEKNPVSVNFSSGFISFMRSAILRYHELGRNQEAREMFDYLREHFPDKMYDQGLDLFLAGQFKFDRDLDDYRVSLSRTQMLIRQAVINYAYNEDEEAVRILNRAREIYNLYQKNVTSKRMAVQATFRELIEQMVEEMGTRLYRGSYEVICKKLGLTPKERPAASRPAA